MDRQEQGHSVQEDRPAAPDPETRAQTLARVVDGGEAVDAAHGGSVDPSTRRGVNGSLARSLLGWGIAGAVVGVLAGALLSVAPGPFETTGLGSAIGFMAVLAVVGALVAGIIATLISLAREDGRIERDSEGG